MLKWKEFKVHTEMHLNLFDDIHAVLAVHHIDSEPSFAEAPRAANPMKVRLIVGVSFHVNWEVKVDHQCHLFNINSLESTET